MSLVVKKYERRKYKYCTPGTQVRKRLAIIMYFGLNRTIYRYVDSSHTCPKTPIEYILVDLLVHRVWLLLLELLVYYDDQGVPQVYISGATVFEKKNVFRPSGINISLLSNK